MEHNSASSSFNLEYIVPRIDGVHIIAIGQSKGMQRLRLVIGLT
jgi:hypothetical protein